MADSSSSAVKIPKLPLTEEPRPLLKDINHLLTCILCNGYFVDATTIVECLHTYCRSCIVKFLQTTKFCPICDVQVHRTKPHLSLRHDAIMQRLVYKVVPGLYKEELQRKKNFLAESDSNTESGPILNGEQETECYIAPDELIPLSLEYIENRTDIHNSDAKKCADSNENSDKEQVIHRRYLACPAKLKIKHLYKFIKEKYELRQNQKVEIFYDNTKLPSSFSFMDIAYTFSWKGDTAMRLCYQILESTIIKVPLPIKDEITDDSALVKNSHITKSSTRSNLNNAVQKTNDLPTKTTLSESSSTKVNLKRKPETVLEIEPIKEVTPPKVKETKEEKKDEFELLEPSVKIPRISNSTLKDIIDAKKESYEDKPKPTATVSPCTPENTLKPQPKPITDDTADDIIKYEQDIEEVDDDDDEDDDRLRISQLSEEDTRDEKSEDPSEQRLVIDSDVESTKDDRKENKLNGDVSKKSAKYKRKNKKSKHSHHHKHHKHHDRKKQSTPQATILHSPDTDIMKLKLKLNNIKPADVKHHKQRRKRKKSSECYFSSSFSSSSSISSASGMSPDARSASRVDEDSSHSQISEFSTDLDTPTKEEPTPKIARVEEQVEKYTQPANKEKLLQMRAFRPKSIAVVKPEENHKLEKHVLEKSKNDNNNNNETITMVEPKEKPKPVPNILRPPSSITVSKITAAEKQKMEQEKLLMMNGNNGDKPSLEIMLVNGPPSSTKSFTSPVSSTTDITSKSKTPPPRQIRPPPAAIPLLQYQKMKSNEQNLPKSLTITPQIQRSKSVDTTKKVKDTLSIRDAGAKRTVTVSLSGNPFENEFPGALDLSAGKASPKYPDMINVPHTLLNKKLCVNGGGIRAMPNGFSNYSPVKCMSSLTDNIRQFHRIPSPHRYPANTSPKHKVSVPPPQTSPKPVTSRTINPKTTKTSVPNLNEIKIGPVSSTTEMPLKPGPNQTVRHIPNPSIMLQRHQSTINSISSTNGVKEYLPIKLPHSTSIMHHRVPANGCSFSTLKKSDKCPPAIPIKGYLDVSTIMATK